MTDTERLNWLQETKASVDELLGWVISLKVGDRTGDGLRSYQWSAKTLRDAIDKAAAALPLVQTAPTVEPNDKKEGSKCDL